MTTSRLMRELQGHVTGQAVPDVRRPRQPPQGGAKGERRERPVRPGCDAGKTGEVQALDPLPVKDPRVLEAMKASTPAKVAVGRAGLRYRTETLLQFMADFAVAKAAVQSQVPEAWAREQGWLPLQTEARDPEEFLRRPDLGRRLSAETREQVRAHCRREPDVQIVVGDGLSATAVLQNAPGMVHTLTEELGRRGISVGTTVFVRHSRARVVDLVGQEVGARVGIILVGERPGLGTGDGMSAYLVWNPSPERTDAEKQAISNIHRRGNSPEDAGRHAANVIEAILRQKTSGVGLDLSGIEAPRTERQRTNQANPDSALGCGQSHGQSCEAAKNGMPGHTCHRTDGRPCQVSRS